MIHRDRSLLSSGWKWAPLLLLGAAIVLLTFTLPARAGGNHDGTCQPGDGYGPPYGHGPWGSDAFQGGSDNSAFNKDNWHEGDSADNHASDNAAFHREGNIPDEPFPPCPTATSTPGGTVTAPATMT